MKVLWTPEARQDRDEILQYIAGDNIDAALRMDELFDAAEGRIATHPKIGKTGEKPETRELIPHQSYRLVYQIKETEIWILALMHTARQWPPE
jgi:addiction module RelE/StbE family toxin